MQLPFDNSQDVHRIQSKEILDAFCTFLIVNIQNSFCFYIATLAPRCTDRPPVRVVFRTFLLALSARSRWIEPTLATFTVNFCE